MSMMLMALLAVLLPSLQAEATRTVSPMQADVDRLVRAAESLAGTWPSQPPPAIPEVAIVARHGKAVVPLLMVLLSDDPNAERDRKRWKVQQQVALTLSRIYSESQHCGRTYCDFAPLPSAEGPTAQRRGGFDPLAVHANHPRPRESSESFRLLAVHAEPDVVTRNHARVWVGLL